LDDVVGHISQIDSELDVVSATRLVPSGLSYDIVCAQCGDLVRRDVRTERAPLYNRQRIEAHLAVCTGPKTWKKLWHKIFRSNSI
jgi:hypothetical protein